MIKSCQKRRIEDTLKKFKPKKDAFDLGVCRRIIRTHVYLKNKSPGLREMNKILLKQMSFPFSRHSLHLILIKMDFKYTKHGRNLLVHECEDLIAE